MKTKKERIIEAIRWGFMIFATGYFLGHLILSIINK